MRFTHTVPVLRQILLVLAGGGLACLWSVDAGYGQTVNRELANPQSPKQQLADSHLSDSSDAARSEWSLNEGWKIHAADRTVDAALGVNWEAWLGPDFDGRATYVRDLQIPETSLEDTGVPDDGRWLIELDGAATEAEVALGGKRLGRHLGGWTPFRFDITDWVQQTCAESEDLESAKSSRTLTVELDEKVGHNTQGFLPIVAPHFGGIWKGAKLIKTAGPLYIDDLTLLVAGHQPRDSGIQVEAMIRGSNNLELSEYEVSYSVTNPGESSPSQQGVFAIKPGAEATMTAAGSSESVGLVRGQIVPTRVVPWSPETPSRYEVELTLRRKNDGVAIDRIARYATIRHFSIDQRRLLLNGEPIVLRGVLNWGYAPPRLAPTVDVAEMRKELQFAKERGFNLMKFCLWLPPQEYLNLADEMGMLTWIEYPTWHPDFSAGKYEELATEFREFFYYDRNVASVALRSLTCETGHSASVEVIQGLYDLGHDLVPGAIIEDDSSWIGWHRVHDFYDDHPYGNNHTWLDKLAELDAHIKARAPKPLVLGEAIAADTWEPNSVMAEEQSPWLEVHRSRSAEDQDRYTEWLIQSHQLQDLAQVRTDSLRVGLTMRKYQIEAFRWRLPEAGYVVSVIRDFPLAGMGLIDRAGKPKWGVSDFSWQGSTQLVLNEARPVRSIVGGGDWVASVDVSSERPISTTAQLRYRWHMDGSNEKLDGEVHLNGADKDSQAQFPSAEVTLKIENVTQPREGTFEVELVEGDHVRAVNRWTLWVVPQHYDQVMQGVSLDSSLDKDIAKFVNVSELNATESVETNAGNVVIASHLDHRLLGRIRDGAVCLMLPDGQPGSFARRDHWFLRGGPVLANHPLVSRLDAKMLADLQTFDLAGPVLYEFPLIEEVTPIVSLWDNHDLTSYRTHALLWEAQVGRGAIICSTLNLGAWESPAKTFVFDELLRYAASGQWRTSAKRLTEESFERLWDDVGRRQISLADANWKFRRATGDEAKQNAADEAWLSETISPAAWKEIEITRHWDGQGHGDLDGWGLYRTSVTVPNAWQSVPLYLTFTGVDDYFEVYVNGERVGSGGDIDRRETAFELRTSFAIPRESAHDVKLEVAVRVYDWQGAGGIFRPVYLATEPIHPGPPLLVEQR